MSEPAAKQFTVWKFPLRLGEVSVSMPQWSKLLHTAMDPASGYPAVWALVDPAATSESRKFAVVGTGQAVPSESLHVGTVLDGQLVWHVFETTEIQTLMAMLGAFR